MVTDIHGCPEGFVLFVAPQLEGVALTKVVGVPTNVVVHRLLLAFAEPPEGTNKVDTRRTFCSEPLYLIPLRQAGFLCPAE